VQQDYELESILGSGSFGTVTKAKHRISGKVVAIKHIPNAFRNSYTSRKVLREIVILRKLSNMKYNLFTPKLYQVIASGFTND
jgi:serine/threonine protein kinase